jgi:hypothetical protein
MIFRDDDIAPTISDAVGSKLAHDGVLGVDANGQHGH